MSPIRLVTFDVTNTIMRVLGSVGQQYASVASIYGQKADPYSLDQSFRTAFKHNMKLYPNFGVHNDLTPFKWWTKVVTETFQSSGNESKQPEQIAQHLYVLFSTAKAWEVLPEATETLSLVKEKGIKIGVISNFDDRLERILTQLSLMHYFDFVLASGVVKVSKPDTEIFKMAFKMADVKPDETLHIGDNFDTDYVGAKTAGCHGVLLLSKDKKVPEGMDSTCVIHSLKELSRFLL